MKNKIACLFFGMVVATIVALIIGIMSGDHLDFSAAITIAFMQAWVAYDGDSK